MRLYAIVPTNDELSQFIPEHDRDWRRIRLFKTGHSKAQSPDSTKLLALQKGENHYGYG
jgi:hypothetical protein